MQEKTLSKPLYICNLYRPPKENLEYYDQFIDEFTSVEKNKIKKWF